MSVVLKGYYDGSGSSTDQAINRVTLAGYAGPLETWATFDERWPVVLAGDGSRPSCRYLHMNELKDLRDEYEGWTEANKKDLLSKVYDALYALAWDRAKNFRALVCTVDLADYDRACRVLPDLKELSPEDICVDHVVMWTLQMIPNDDTKQTQKAGAVELFFDQNEPFRGKLMPRWNMPWHRRDSRFRCIAAINEADMRLTPGLQASDYIAWNTNRYRSTDDIGAQIHRLFSSRPYEVFYGYEQLVATYRKGFVR